VRRPVLAFVALLLALAATAPARAAAPVQSYGSNDFGGFRDVLPPGANGFDSAAQATAFRAGGTRPDHNDDQLAMYRDLLTTSSDRPQDFFKDATFGVRPGDTARTYSPGDRQDVTVVRDRSFGVPHIYATTRAGGMFALGYVTAEDRLFVMDLLRHLGRAQLSSFAGGAAYNRALDQLQWQQAPYTEDDLQRQLDMRVQRFGADGAQLSDDLDAYRDGVNRYIAEAKLDPSKMPAEYAQIGRSGGPDPWRATDQVAIAAVMGTTFGHGGGQELQEARLYQAFQARFGRVRGARLWRQFSEMDDPEAPTTVHGTRFPYETWPRRLARGSAAIPDRGSLVDQPIVSEGVDAGATGASATRAAGDPQSLLAFPATASSALLVSARESASGHPLAVF
jgi:acyl-homoserine lactone acylase PvdQ